MKKLFILILLVTMSITLTSCEKTDTGPSGPVPVVEPDCKTVDFVYDYDTLTYNLVWSDEFDGTELDLDKWRYEINGGGGGNNELQYYTDQNTVVEDGILKIIARKEEFNNREYTSSRITTQNKFEFTYGIVEIRSKQPAGKGTWAAHWMMPAKSLYGGWPSSGEIDIMEFVGYDSTKIHSTIHTKLFNHPNNTQKGRTKTVEDATTAFHVYKVEWLPDKMIFSIDDVTFFTYQPGKYVDCPLYDQWPFDKDFFVILNIAIGGDWGGAQGIDDTAFPTTMEIDYVRIYQATEFEELE